MASSKVYFVSLGPGDPKLITLKALEILKDSDIIFSPSTQGSKSIEVASSGFACKSRGLNILLELGLDSEKIQLFNFPMSKKRDAAIEDYRDAAADIVRYCAEDKRVSVVAEGDSGFYSSIRYIQDFLYDKNISVSRVAGIPAFIAAGATAALSIAEQEERLLVIPGVVSSEELKGEICSGKSLVIMKLSQCEKEIKSCIRELKADSLMQIQLSYFQDIGTKTEYFTNDPEEILGCKFPYFSIMLVKKMG